MSRNETIRDGLAVVVGTGHLGRNMIRALVDQGRETIRVVVNTNARQEANLLPRLRQIEIVFGDVTDPESLLKPFRGAHTVFNTSGLVSIKNGSDWKALEQINVRGVGNVISAASAGGVEKVICFSSIHAIEQNPTGEVLDESRSYVEMRRNPNYDQSKVCGEKLAIELMKKGLVDGSVLIPTGMVGPEDNRPSDFGDVLLRLARGKMPFLVKGGMDWVDIRDVCLAALRAENTANTGDRFILSGHYVDLRETARIVEEVSGVQAPEIYLPMWAAEAVAPLALKWTEMLHQRPVVTPLSIEALRGNRMISHQHAKDILGFEPRSYDKTIQDTLEWLLKNIQER